MYLDREPDQLATPIDAMHEFARNAGDLWPDREWLLTDYDVWVPNPHFRGTRTGIHPEDAVYMDADDPAFFERPLNFDDAPLVRSAPQYLPPPVGCGGDEDIPF